MITRILTAAGAAALLLALTSSIACADMVQLRDGQWLPKKLHDDMGDAPAPGDGILARSGKNNLDLEFDNVKCAGASVSAGLVDDEKVFSTTAYLNEFFRNGELQGQASAWEEAADSYGQAAESLKGAGKQIAMWKRVLCLAQTGNGDKTLAATKELLEAFPRAFYLAKVRTMRARIFLGKKKPKEAAAELDMVIAAAGMNARDYFAAKLAKTRFFKLIPAGKDPKKIALARTEYERIASEIRGRTGAATEAAVQMLRANVGVGRCLVYEGDFDKALNRLQQVVDDKHSVQDKTLLAQAYTGMGDAAYAKIKAELATGKVQKDQLDRVQESLTTAALHYLRTSKFYVEYAGDDRYPATVGLARVWATQFELGGDKDCALAKRAAKTYIEAHGMLPRGEQQRLLTREAKMFLDKRRAACP